MNMLNQIILEGNVEHIDVNPLVAVTTFTMSTSRMYKTADDKVEEEKSFFDVKAWGRIGKFASTVKTGQGIRIVGRLKQERWKDADGKEHSKVVVVAEHIEIKPNEGGGSMIRI